MRNKLLLILCLAVFTSNCQNKTNESNDSKCEELFKKYKEKFSTSDIDSTRYYIESAMKCAPENKNFIDNSIRFYIKVADYKVAIKQVEKLKDNRSDISLDFMISVLKLKMGNPTAKKDLKKIYIQYNADKSLTSSNLIYKVALDNYFNDKNYALNRLKDYRKAYTTEYDIQNLDAAENLIKSVDKDEVLFALFNLKR
jgi:hypothetical protein